MCGTLYTAGNKVQDYSKYCIPAYQHSPRPDFAGIERVALHIAPSFFYKL